MKKKRPWGILILLSVLLFVTGNRLAIVFLNTPGNIFDQMTRTLSLEFVKLTPQAVIDLSTMQSAITGLVLVAILWLFYLYQYGGRRNFMEGKEHGSARWGKAAAVKPYTDADPQQNILLASDVALALSNQKLEGKYHTNKNIMVVGGSGSGKTRYYVTGNILQAHSCYVITDPKGTLLPMVGNSLQEAGYQIKYFNTIDFTKSMHYNPFAYIRKESDILRFVDGLIENTKGEGQQGDKFWLDAEKLLYTALIAYVMYEAPEQERNFDTFLCLFDGLEIRENDENYTSPIDILFEELETAKGETFAGRQYGKFKNSAGKTAKSILISCGARLAPFDIPEIRELMRYDELNFDRIGFEKIALFLILDDYDPTFNFLVGILYTQLLGILIRNADQQVNGSLPIHTRLILDEFANTGRIPHFEQLTGQIRSRGISTEVILQSPEQLKAIYRDKANIITGNMDTLLFLGSGDLPVGKYISERLGKTTIDHVGHSESKGKQGTSSQSEHIVSRDLMTATEVTQLPTEECIVFIKGLPPIRTKKYDLKQHPRYGLTADANRGNQYNPYRRGGDRGTGATAAVMSFLEDVTMLQQMEL